jgi:hypothetical protein
MIEAFTKAWFANLHTMREKFTAKHPDSYIDVVRALIEMLSTEAQGEGWDFHRPDPDRIHEIDDGDYQGYLLYAIGAQGYQPSTYWTVLVGYGSCSGCDTLQAISSYSSEPPNDDQVTQYMQLALHVVQGLRLVGGDAA